MDIERQILKDINPAFKCKDFLVSNASFDVCYNRKYHLYFTYPLPKNLGLYYQSEEYISHSKKQKGFTANLYRIIRGISFKKKEQIIRPTNLPKKILDVGAGTGMFLKYCEKKKWQVHGVEPSKKARIIAKENNIELLENLLDVNENEFSTITLWHVLEHIPNLSETIIHLKDKLTKNGRLIIAVPNFESYDASFYKEYWAAYDVPRHIWHFSKKSIETIFNSFDMEIERIIPMKFDSYYVSLLSEKNKTGNHNFLKALFHGFVSNQKAKSTNNYSSLIYCIKNKK